MQILKILFILPLAMATALTIASCGGPREWEQAEYDGSLKCDSLYTGITEPHMSYPDKSNAYFDGDTLVVSFPPDIPGWQWVEVRIIGGKFRAETGGIPFKHAELSFKTLRQALQLGSEHYELGDTLCGRFDFRFQNSDAETGQSAEWTFRGAICEVIRDRDFDPFAGENFMALDLPAALHEMGDPLDRYRFNMLDVPGFRVLLLNYFPASEDIWVEEATWDISARGEVSDMYGSVDLLTVWYVRAKDRRRFRDTGWSTLPGIWNRAASDTLRWLPVHYLKYSSSMQF